MVPVVIPRLDDLLWRLDFNELAASWVNGTVGKAHAKTPSTADSKICSPNDGLVRFGRPPPVFNLLRRECTENVLHWLGDLSSCEDGVVVRHRARHAGLDMGWCHIVLSPLPAGGGLCAFEYRRLKQLEADNFGIA